MSYQLVVLETFSTNQVSYVALGAEMRLEVVCIYCKLLAEGAVQHDTAHAKYVEVHIT